MEAEDLRDQIAAGFNKLFDSSMMCTLFAYSLEELDKNIQNYYLLKCLKLNRIKTSMGNTRTCIPFKYAICR